MFPEGATHLPTHKNANGSWETILPVDWKETQATCCLCLASSALRPQGNQFYQVMSFTAAEGDKPKVQSHVVIKLCNEYWIGTVREVLVPVKKCLASHVVISLFEFLPGLHPHLCVPCIKYPTPEEMVIMPPSVSFVSIMSWL